MRSGDDVAVETPAMGVFDCDGVLVDSEMLACRVEAELLSGLGLSVTAHEIAARFVGLSDSEMHALIEDEFGVALSATFNTDKVKRLAEVFEAEFRPVDGIAEVVAAVSVPRCVASSSDPVRIRRSLELPDWRSSSAHTCSRHRWSPWESPHRTWALLRGRPRTLVEAAYARMARKIAETQAVPKTLTGQ
jgi:hypothetical protein